VTQAHDSLEAHFHDTVAGGDWLCEQDVVEYFVGQAHEEMVQMEHWGCPGAALPTATPTCAAFGGMKIERTWFAADKTGFHMLHTLFQTSIKYPSIKALRRTLLRRPGGRRRARQGVVAIDIARGEFTADPGQGRDHRHRQARGPRVPREHNGGIVTGDGMALAYRHGVPLRDMEFVQYHPTCMPGTGLLVHRGLPRRRRLPAQQGRLPLPAGLRPRARPPTPRQQGDGARARATG
jgi:fumarate reductase flavoprotein subunit